MYDKQAKLKNEWFEQNLSMPHFAIHVQKYKNETLLAHFHDFHQILIFDEGGGTHILNNITYPIADYSIHFVPEGTVHYLQESPPCYRFLFKKDYFENCPIKDNFMNTLPFFKHLSTGHILTFEQDTFERIKNLVGEIIQKYEDRHKEKRRCEIIQLLIHLFLLECDIKGTDKSSIKLETAHNPIPEILKKLIQSIEINFRKRWKVQQYADNLYISTSQLNRHCQTVFQKSVQDMIQERSLKEAKNLLLNTQTSIKEIGYKVGFDHPSNFINFFIKKVGISPTQFRKKCA